MSSTSLKMRQEEEEELREEIVEFEWEKSVYVPVTTSYLAYPIYSESRVSETSKFSVFVQGNLETDLQAKTIFLTVHDIGRTHHSFVDFVNSEPMADIKKRAVFLHVCVPGQEPGAKQLDLEIDYPTMEQIGQALAQVMAKFNLNKCVAIGEGAGADICCRFAMNFHNLLNGLVLIHCTSTTHGFLEHIKEMLANLRLDDGKMSQSTWNYLLSHRFGNNNMDERQKAFVERVKNVDHINETNLSRYIYSFVNRSDFTDALKEELAKVDAVLVTGGKSSHNGNVQHMFEHMNKSKTALLVAEDCVDVLEEAPDYVASAVLLLCQRKGILPDVDLPIETPGMPESLTCTSASAAEEKDKSDGKSITA